MTELNPGGGLRRPEGGPEPHAHDPKACRFLLFAEALPMQPLRLTAPAKHKEDHSVYPATTHHTRQASS